MSQPIRVLHFSTHNEDCGIGKYQEMFIEAMHADGYEVQNEFFPVSPNKTRFMNAHDLKKTINQLRDMLQDFDILHVQHEYSFYTYDEMAQIVQAAKSMGKKVVITIHTSPNIIDLRIDLGRGFGPRSIYHNLRVIRRKYRFNRSYTKPLQHADMVLLHNRVTKEAIVKLGIDPGKVRKIVIPVPTYDHSVKNDIIDKNLRTSKDDVILATFGFIHRYKGIKEAIKSLKYLPGKYKLAIVGGLHPHTDDVKIYDDITDLITTLDLQHRVYITGYIKDDEEANAAVRSCDICLYPYDNDYYSNVSSAALNNSFANHVPAIVYPTASFKEIAAERDGALTLTESFSYYELMREIKRLYVKKAKERAIAFAEAYSYPNQSKKLVDFYKELV